MATSPAALIRRAKSHDEAMAFRMTKLNEAVNSQNWSMLSRLATMILEHEDASVTYPSDATRAALMVHSTLAEAGGAKPQANAFRAYATSDLAGMSRFESVFRNECGSIGKTLMERADRDEA